MKTDLEDDLVAATDPHDAILNEAPEDKRWDPIGGSEGERVKPLYGDDEDEDGRSGAVTLVEEGIAAAEFDQMLQADKADPDRDDELSDDEVEARTDKDIDILDEDTDDVPGLEEEDDDDDSEDLDNEDEDAEGEG
ncbi:MAG: hypothetical protein JWO94_343 [Verrucomicrobiaceae bacterium]|nr:hypothetical protein [Verrucomicrobiaceae bacterium]